LQYIELMLSRTGGFGDFQKYLIPKLLPIYDRVGFENRDSDSFMTIALREHIINTVCELDYEPCVRKASALLQSWMASPGTCTETGIFFLNKYFCCQCLYFSFQHANNAY
jgi:hypothetical protein